MKLNTISKATYRQSIGLYMLKSVLSAYYLLTFFNSKQMG